MYSPHLQTGYSIPGFAPAPGAPKFDRENVEVVDAATVGGEKLCETPDPKDIRPSFLLNSVCVACTAMGSLLVLSCDADEVAADAPLLRKEHTHNQYSILKIVYSFLNTNAQSTTHQMHHHHKHFLR